MSNKGEAFDWKFIEEEIFFNVAFFIQPQIIKKIKNE